MINYAALRTITRPPSSTYPLTTTTKLDIAPDQNLPSPNLVVQAQTTARSTIQTKWSRTPRFPSPTTPPRRWSTSTHTTSRQGTRQWNKIQKLRKFAWVDPLLIPPKKWRKMFKREFVLLVRKVGLISPPFMKSSILPLQKYPSSLGGNFPYTWNFSSIDIFRQGPATRLVSPSLPMSATNRRRRRPSRDKL